MTITRRFSLLLVIIDVIGRLTSASGLNNNTFDLQDGPSVIPCVPPMGIESRGFMSVSLANITHSVSDLSQFEYGLEVVHSIQKDSWYDYIVIGAGTGGSVVASRLSEDPSVRVLLMEAGGKEDWFNQIPGATDFLRRSWRDYAYSTVPQKKCCGQLINNQNVISRGKLIGGSSSINGAAWQRCPPEDYDRWDRVYGAKGWSFRDVFPYFVKSESVEPDERLDRGYHGTLGPYPVRLSDPSEFTETFSDALRELGYPIGDYNGRDPVRSQPSQNGYRLGLRYSTGRAYLSQASIRPNLDILIFARADRILFDDGSKKAIGVEYTANSQKNRVFAGKEIVVSAGAIDTPKILLLSGIGPAEELKSLGIPVMVDLPGVGKNYHDQPRVNLPFATVPSNSSDDILRSINEFFFQRQGSLARTSTGFFLSFLRTKQARDSRPDIEFQIINGLFEGLVPLDQRGWFLNWRPEFKRSYYQPYDGKDGFQIEVLVTIPFSRGWVKLASKDPDQAPLIDSNFFDDERDLEVLLEGCRVAHRLTQTGTLSRLKPRFLGVLPQCKDLPLFSDKYFRCMIPIMADSFLHPVGSAKMGPPSDRFAVLDPELRVYGVKGLRVADASVMPETVSGHPMAAIIMIGERCADFIKGRQLKPALPPIENEKQLLSYH